MTRFQRQVGGTLDARYRIEEVLPGPATESAFTAVHLASGEQVALVELAAAEVTLLQRGVLACHRSLATLRELIDVGEERWVGVFDHVRGPSLAAEVTHGRRLSPRLALRLGGVMADALSVLHQRGAAHGLLRPEGLLMTNRVRKAPVLTYVPLARNSPYHSPGRRKSGPSMADDLWAVGAVLHMAVLGEPPPREGYVGATAVRAAGVESPLAEVLASCLARDERQRPRSASSLRGTFGLALDSLEAGPPAVEPAPLPVGTQTATQPTVSGATMQSAPPDGEKPRRAGSRSLLFVAVAAAAATATVAIGVPWEQPELVQSVSSASTESPTPSSSQAQRPPIEEDDDDIVQVDALPSESQLATCVARQFPSGSFEETPDYSWLCLTTDPREGVVRMRRSLVLGAGKHRLTPAMDIWSRIGWYGMAGFAVVRDACCADAQPIALPPTSGCPPLDAIINRLVRAVRGGEDVEPRIDEYTQNVRCQLQQGNGRELWVSQPLAGGQDTALRRLLEEQ